MGVVHSFPLKVHLLHKATCKVTTFEKLNHTFHPKTFLSRRLPSNNHKRGQSSDISQDLTRSLTTLNPAHLHVSPTLAIWCESHFSTRHSRSIWNSLRFAIGLSEGEVIFRHRRTSVTWFTSPALPKSSYPPAWNLIWRWSWRFISLVPLWHQNEMCQKWSSNLDVLSNIPSQWILAWSSFISI